ncbi:MAG: acyl-CoA dehydrogenase, partial [Steroidobacteraceae bacterium]
MIIAAVAVLLLLAGAFALTQSGWLLTAAFVVAVLVLAYQRLSLLVYSLAFTALLALYTLLGHPGGVWKGVLWVLLVALWLFNLRPLRRALISRPFLKSYLRLLPSMSATEREALSAGTVWWDGELFTGKPDWKKLLDTPAATLKPHEQAFYDGPVQQLCALSDDFDITHRRGDMPPDVWEFIKSNGFFAMIIPKKYGGLELGTWAQSCVLTRLASRSITVASTVAVPNSLGPAELLVHYGTDEQRDYYLPRLARGEEIPCFALTSPRVGSDAASITDTGVVCHGEWQGKTVLGLRLNFDKRYITLAPVATVVGLAFQMLDPDRLLGGETTIGITCALLPRDLPGITIGRRHFPLNVPFQNGPIQGRDVFVPLDVIIGGVANAGKGWRMLVEQLSVGRCISLPASASGGAVTAAWASGAYTRIRKQFCLPVGKFEGVEQLLARIAGLTYIMTAARAVTTGAIDSGAKPAVPAAILKYHVTEFGRQVAADAMDVHGGKGIMLGPRNYLGRAWQAAPIGITVEGANILTRNLIIFGQGAI